MLRAIELAKNGLGKTFPNPIVGAVIIDSAGNIISEGFHQGGDHAEVVAIKNAPSIPEDATIVVTLEPCNHFGKTPPCTQAILDSKIKNAVFAVSDPNPQASGGADFLRSQGVQVTAGVCQSEAAWSNRAWLTKIQLGRPRFIWKVATTLDSKVNASDGSSKWISGEESRKKVSLMRNRTDAILAGTGTVLADNPSFNVRRELVGDEISIHNPERIIFGNREIPVDFLVNDGSVPTAFIVSNDLSELIDITRINGYNEVMVESGSTLGTALLESGIIDELHLFIAPKLLGNGANFLGDIGISNIAAAKTLEFISVGHCGNDVEIVAVVHNVKKVGE